MAEQNAQKVRQYLIDGKPNKEEEVTSKTTEELNNKKDGQESVIPKKVEEYEYPEGYYPRLVRWAVDRDLFYYAFLVMRIVYCVYHTAIAPRNIGMLWDLALILGVFFHYFIIYIKRINNVRVRVAIVGVLMTVLFYRNSFVWSTNLLLAVVLLSRKL